MPPDTSNPLRLSPREWLLALGLLAIIFLGIPQLWPRLEPLPAGGADRRFPYALGNDYWVYDRYSRACADQVPHMVLMLGDSVVWGHYVRADQTLTARLNRFGAWPVFFNLGVDGIHPAAMTGLLQDYGRAVAGRSVVLQCNPLWMTSARRDLQGDKEDNFNHPALVPQLHPWLRVYSAPLAERIGTVVGHHVPLMQWARHLEIAYFDSQDIAGWTLGNPYACPVRQVTLRLPDGDQRPDPPPVAEPWTAARGRPANFPWVDLDTSFQWKSFQSAVHLLQSRRNRVFVLVGPFNEHMLTPNSREKYQHIKAGIHGWLASQRIPHLVARPVPSDLYADASHPLALGYAHLARQMVTDATFRAFLRGEDLSPTGCCELPYRQDCLQRGEVVCLRSQRFRVMPCRRNQPVGLKGGMRASALGRYSRKSLKRAW